MFDYLNDQESISTKRLDIMASSGGSSGAGEGESVGSVPGPSGSFLGSEQISMDMLRNTPSNIRRLADEIEQFEGRQKYLAQTRSPSDGGDVRWYFCKVPLADDELAAAIPRAEVVGKSDYFRFGMRDSLAIEASFLQREEEFLSSWWQEYAECSEGPRAPSNSNSKLDSQKKASSLDRAQSAKLYEIEEERVGVPVKGGLYEVDLVRRHCFPVYWNGENRRVLRGHWFARKGSLDWLPLREDVAEQLEGAYRRQVWHRRTFQPSGLFAARVDLQGSTPGLHALFTGEDDTWDAWLNVDASGFPSIVNIKGNGIRLRRGYAPSQSPKPTQDELRQQKEEEMDDYCSQVPVQHLVFMVHGIGQRLEKANLVDDVSTFRHITARLAEQHLTSYQRGTQRVLYIPCQWRKDLKLSGETAVEKITLDGVKGLRVMLSATVHDVLYYMSPIYCQDIINSVSNQLNRLYLKFLKRNPGYDGKVSLYGHSLGSVLSYDILCHQENLSSPFPMDWMYHEHDKNETATPNISKNSSQYSSSHVGDDDLTYNENVSVEATIGDDKITESKVSLEGHTEESSNLPSPPVVSDSDEPSTVARYSKQLNTPSSDEDGTEPIHGPTVMSFHTSGDLDECTSMNSRALVGDPNKIGEESAHSDEGKTLKSLTEEIDFLNARIKELESQCNAGATRTNQETTSVPNDGVSESVAPEKTDTMKSYTPYIHFTKLEFKVDTFFAVGSPLGVFLSLRNVRIGIGRGKEYWEDDNIIEEMPACRQMFNIFHPFDPVAYRIEPLVCKEFIDERPVIIPYHRGGKRLHIGFQEFTEDIASRSQAVIEHICYAKVKVLTLCQSSKNESLDETLEKTQDKEERSYGSVMMERLTGSKDGRVDHVLQDKTFQHQYISAIGAHTNYWRDYDTALFMLKHLYRDIPDEPGTSHNPSKGKEGWFDHREVEEEEFPLTFADRVSVKNFSRRATTMKR